MSRPSSVTSKVSREIPLNRDPKSVLKTLFDEAEDLSSKGPLLFRKSVLVPILLAIGTKSEINLIYAIPSWRGQSKILWISRGPVKSFKQVSSYRSNDDDCVSGRVPCHFESLGSNQSRFTRCFFDSEELAGVELFNRRVVLQRRSIQRRSAVQFHH